MIIQDYYTIDSIRHEDGRDIVDVSLNPDCKVYEGHFPGEPISPGVCNIQMIKECAETVLGHPLVLSTVGTCRFINLVTPSAVPHASVVMCLEQKDNVCNLSASLIAGDVEYMILKATLNG